MLGLLRLRYRPSSYQRLLTLHLDSTHLTNASLLSSTFQLLKTQPAWLSTSTQQSPPSHFFIPPSPSITLDDIQQSNERCKKQFIEIRQTPHHGWGLFALRDWKKGEVIMQGRIVQTLSTRHSHTIQTDWNTHVVMDLPSRLINHVCGGEANVVSLPPPTTATDASCSTDNSSIAHVFVARVDIPCGEELRWDYETAEYEMNMTCSCGSSACRGQLRGFRYHGEMVRSLYGEEHIAPYLRQQS